ncbi:MAG: intradiol ring-cleavage dioxygenase [Nocardioidaceae bacterium]
MRHGQEHDRVPTYEGRPLARPEEEVVDQGLGFDVTTLLSRRQTLRVLGLGAAALGLAACELGSTPSGGGTPSSASPAARAGAIPEETGGPFPADGSNGPDVLEQSGIVRSDIRSSLGGAGATADGVPMTLELVVTDATNGGAPLTGAAVYVWHCDHEGRYSLYSPGAEDRDYLRGVQVADADGRVRFTSIFPACYPGRWPHVHFEVYADRGSIAGTSNVIATSQLALPADVCERVYVQNGYEASVTALSEVSLDSDIVFADDGAARQLATVTGDVSRGYVVTLAVPVDAGT